MAGSRIIQCVGSSAPLADRKASSRRTINMYLEHVEGFGEARELILVSAPGFVSLGVVRSGGFRGARNVGGRLFIAQNDLLVEFDPITGVVTTIGTLGTLTGFVGMAHNATQLAVVDGTNLYVVTLATNVFTTITSATAAWLGSSDVHEIDGYAVFVRPNSDQFFISANDNFSSLDALDFSSADSIPDVIVTHRVFNKEIWFFGAVSTEIWVNSGGAAFPFTRYLSAPLPFGIVGPRAAVVATDQLFWIGQSDHGRGIVYRTASHSPTRISTQSVEEALSSSSDLASATMWTYQVSGHEFVGITAPGMETTWVYDAATQEWAERAMNVNGSWRPLPITQVVYRSGVHYALGDDYGNRDGYCYRLDATAYSYDSSAVPSPSPLVRERTWPHLVAPSMEPVNYRSLELACTKGNGGNVTLEISNDGAETFGPGLLRSMGATGRFKERVRWHSLGSAEDRVFRIRCSDEVPFSIYDAALDAA